MGITATGRTAGITAALLLGALPGIPGLRAGAEARQQPTPPPQKPAVSIPVGPLGYMPPGAFYLTYRLSSATVGFLDDDHVLFTFRVGGLLRRLPSDRDGDEDQQIRAMVLDLKTGKVERQTEWRMHDRIQYLWPFTDGKFLVRVRDTLYVTDRRLELEPYLQFSTELRSLQISPNRRTMLVESNAPAQLHPAAGGTPGTDTPVMVQVLPVGSKEVTAESRAPAASLLPLMDDGMLDALEGKAASTWVVEDVPFRGTSRIMAEVKSQCRPEVQPVSATVALVEGCYANDDTRLVTAVSTHGEELWQQQWQNRYVWGWFDSAENGSRFVYESLQVNQPITTFEPLYIGNITAQMAGVYDTESGKLVLVTDASPILSAGQNVALSPDGTRFAVLRRGAIEVYDLPAVEAATPATAPGTAARKKK